MIFYFAEKSENQIPFLKLEVDHVLCDLYTFCCSRVEFAFLLTKKGNELYFKKPKVQQRKIEFE